MKYLITLVFLTQLLAHVLATYAESPRGEPTNAAETASKRTKIVPAIEAKYFSLVAALPADQQVWERKLQENLGSFYLPNHQRQRVEGRSSCWDFVQDDFNLPRVLLIGDSVSGGYTLATRTFLAGKANVHKAPENCGPTANGLKKLDHWLGDGKWQVIHFNFGLHDSKTSVADYEARLRQIVVRLQKTGAKLIWASTTPRPADAKEGLAFVAAVVERNEVAVGIMSESGIWINDLFTYISPHVAQVQRPKDVHFTPEGYQLLGRRVAAEIEARLK